MNKAKKVKKEILSILICIFAALVMSFAFTSFIQPLGLYPAGYSGLSRIISDVFKDYFNITIDYNFIYFPLNVITSFFVYKYVGKRFTLLSIFTVVCYTGFNFVLKPYLNLEDPILVAVFAGIVNGFGCGLCLQQNACAGGADFLAVYFGNKYKKPIWNALMIFNCCLLLVAGLIYGWEIALYSIIMQYCSTQVVNRMHKRYTKIQLEIITDKPQEVSKSILSDVRHGITSIDCKGVYSNADKTLLLMVINGFQEEDVVNDILTADPGAFINITHSKKVIGNFYQKPLD